MRYPSNMCVPGRKLRLVLPLLFLFVGCAPESEETLMKSGLDALYTRHDPATAAAQFRKVLQINPTHYGATYQLAAALDAAGKSEEARAVWEKMLPMAESINDKSSADTARAHLADAEMKAGLDALSRHDAAAAIVRFRKALEYNPTHYGANYQLASALDAADKADEARPLWEKVLRMADETHDEKTASTARAHLNPQP